MTLRRTPRVPPHSPCRTAKAGRITDTHLSRIDAAYPRPLDGRESREAGA